MGEIKLIVTRYKISNLNNNTFKEIRKKGHPVFVSIEGGWMETKYIFGELSDTMIFDKRGTLFSIIVLAPQNQGMNHPNIFQ